jgi:hypothetical protein
MTNQYKIVSIEETSGNELTIDYMVKPDGHNSFKLSITVKHDMTEDKILKLINATAYSNIERRKKKEKKDEIEKANIDVLKKSIDRKKDVDVDITEPDDESEHAFE